MENLTVGYGSNSNRQGTVLVFVFQGPHLVWYPFLTHMGKCLVCLEPGADPDQGADGRIADRSSLHGACEWMPRPTRMNLEHHATDPKGPLVPSKEVLNDPCSPPPKPSS